MRRCSKTVKEFTGTDPRKQAIVRLINKKNVDI